MSAPALITRLKDRYRERESLQGIRNVYHQYLHLRSARPVFFSIADLWRYHRLRRANRRFREGNSTRPATLRLSALRGGSVQCRPGTTDDLVLMDTFRSQFHVPPIPLPDDAVIVDLGANVGFTALHLGTLFPHSRIIAVEMDDKNLAMGRENTRALGERCVWVHAAIWNEDAVVSYSGAEEWGFRVTPGATRMSRQVGAMTMGNLLDRLAIERVDYLKMDIEGAEARVLDGAAEWLDRVHAIRVEVHEPATVDWCQGTLLRHGFRAFVDHRHWSCVAAIRDAKAPA